VRPWQKALIGAFTAHADRVKIPGRKDAWNTTAGIIGLVAGSSREKRKGGIGVMLRSTKLSHLLFLAILFVHGPAVRAGSVEDPIGAEIRRQNIAGLAVVVVRDGRTARLSTYGSANIELGVPVNEATIFQAGSTAKQFAALGILILQGEGKLSVDDRFSKFFPEAPRQWEDITLRHMMAHLSGLAEDVPDVDWQASLSVEELQRALFRTPKGGPAGSRWAYSNAAYILLGMLIEKIAGKPYHAFLEERIFRPLGMHATRQISEEEIILNRADGYERLGDKAGAPLRNQRWVAQVFNSTADGSTYITPKDYARYLASLDAPPRDLAPHYRDMFRSQSLIAPGSTIAYGYGWFLTELKGMPVQYHSGTWQGFRANLIRYPDRKTSLVILANSDVPERQKLIATVVAETLPGFPVPTEW
jgi:CubicO group peptidase (beta-lactamase class C family)